MVGSHSGGASKLLSVCLHGRNDEYGGNFRYHLSLTLNFLASNLAQLDCLDEVEVLVTDWNSPTPLAEVLDLIPEACRVTSFIEVDEKTALLRNHADTDYHTSISQNVSLRRARGKYILMIPADGLLTLPMLRQMMALLHNDLVTTFAPEKTCMGLIRKFIPNSFRTPRSPRAFGEIETYIAENDQNLMSGRHLPGLLSGFGGLLISNELCAELRGFSEKLGGWGYQDIELGLRINAKYDLVNISHLGVYVYDFEPDDQFKQTKAQRINNMPEVTESPNDANWGLGDYGFAVTVPDSRTNVTVPETAIRSASEVAERALREENVLDAMSMIFASSESASFAEVFCEDAACSKLLTRQNSAATIHIVIPEKSHAVYDPRMSVAVSTALDEDRHKGALRFFPGVDAWVTGTRSLPVYDVILFHAGQKDETSAKAFQFAVERVSPTGVLVFSGEGATVAALADGVGGIVSSLNEVLHVFSQPKTEQEA